MSRAGGTGEPALVLADVRVHGRGDAPRDVVLGAGRIEAITAPGAVRDRERVVLDGAVVLPGLWDRHVHLEQWALVRRRLDLASATSAAHAAALVAAAAAEPGRAAPGELLVGYGFRDGLWPDAPAPGMLGEEVPVALVSGDLHCVWTNRAAMALLGDGLHPGGLLREDEAFRVNGQISAVGTTTMDGWVRDALRAAAERGVVGVVDLEMEQAVTAWERRAAAGAVGVRVRAGVYPDRLEAEAARGLRTGTPLSADGRVTVGPLKIVADGSLNTRTAWCHDPYPGAPDWFGRPTYTSDELELLVRRGTELGFDPAIHAIGDRALAAALDAVEAVGCRGSVEHAQLVGDDDAVRMARLGLVASVQPEHAMDDRDVADRHWAGRTHRAFAVGALHRAGVRLALGSDAPVAPLDPWVTIHAAVERSRDGREPWHPEQTISLHDAVAASTTTDGVVAVGDAADLVVVPDDPAGRSGEELRATPVLMTLVGGEVTADLR